jgi:ribose 5-phosphate isomerase B
MIDGAGIGSCMVANKVAGIRAAMCYDEASARNSREHNGANVLTLGAKAISLEQMRNIVRTWLSTDLTEERHRRRVAKIDALL